MLVVMPCAVAACALAVAYSPSFQAIHWYSGAGMVLIAGLMGGETMLSLAISRLGRRFDRV